MLSPYSFVALRHPKFAEHVNLSSGQILGCVVVENDSRARRAPVVLKTPPRKLAAGCSR